MKTPGEKKKRKKKATILCQGDPDHHLKIHTERHHKSKNVYANAVFVYVTTATVLLNPLQRAASWKKACLYIFCVCDLRSPRKEGS